MQLSQSESGFVLDVLNRSDIIAIIGKKNNKLLYQYYQLLDNNQNSDMYLKKKIKMRYEKQLFDVNNYINVCIKL